MRHRSILCESWRFFSKEWECAKGERAIIEFDGSENADYLEGIVVSSIKKGRISYEITLESFKERNSPYDMSDEEKNRSRGSEGGGHVAVRSDESDFFSPCGDSEMGAFFSTKRRKVSKLAVTWPVHPEMSNSNSTTSNRKRKRDQPPPVLARQAAVPSPEPTAPSQQNQSAVATQLTGELAKCRRIVKDLLTNPKHKDFSYPFYHPVDPSILLVNDYHEVIRFPMDLSTVCAKLDNGEYDESNGGGGVSSFKADMRLIVANCYTYNGRKSPYGKLCSKFETAIEKMMGKVKGGSQVRQHATLEREKVVESIKLEIATVRNSLSALGEKLSEIIEKVDKLLPLSTEEKAAERAVVPAAIVALPSRKRHVDGSPLGAATAVSVASNKVVTVDDQTKTIDEATTAPDSIPTSSKRAKLSTEVDDVMRKITPSRPKRVAKAVKGSPSKTQVLRNPKPIPARRQQQSQDTSADRHQQQEPEPISANRQQQPQVPPDNCQQQPKAASPDRQQHPHVTPVNRQQQQQPRSTAVNREHEKQEPQHKTFNRQKRQQIKQSTPVQVSAVAAPAAHNKKPQHQEKKEIGIAVGPVVSNIKRENEGMLEITDKGSETCFDQLPKKTRKEIREFVARRLADSEKPLLPSKKKTIADLTVAEVTDANKNNSGSSDNKGQSTSSLLGTGKKETTTTFDRNLPKNSTICATQSQHAFVTGAFEAEKTAKQKDIAQLNASDLTATIDSEQLSAIDESKCFARKSEKGCTIAENALANATDQVQKNTARKEEDKLAAFNERSEAHVADEDDTDSEDLNIFAMTDEAALGISSSDDSEKEKDDGLKAEKECVPSNVAVCSQSQPSTKPSQSGSTNVVSEVVPTKPKVFHNTETWTDCTPEQRAIINERKRIAREERYRLLRESGGNRMMD